LAFHRCYLVGFPRSSRNRRQSSVRQRTEPRRWLGERRARYRRESAPAHRPRRLANLKFQVIQPDQQRWGWSPPATRHSLCDKRGTMVAQSHRGRCRSISRTTRSQRASEPWQWPLARVLQSAAWPRRLAGSWEADRPVAGMKCHSRRIPAHMGARQAGSTRCLGSPQGLNQALAVT